jgi:hypothetical protein
MPKRISDLQPGDQIFGWMKIGFALQKQRNPDGTLFRTVPSRKDRFDKDDLQQFVGMVVSNDTVNHVLRVDVARMTKLTRAVEPPLPAEIHYLAFSRVRLISKYPLPGRPQNPLWPTQVALGTGFYAYRTQEEVLLTWT